LFATERNKEDSSLYLSLLVQKFSNFKYDFKSVLQLVTLMLVTVDCTIFFRNYVSRLQEWLSNINKCMALKLLEDNLIYFNIPMRELYIGLGLLWKRPRPVGEKVIHLKFHLRILRIFSFDKVTFLILLTTPLGWPLNTFLTFLDKNIQNKLGLHLIA